jgi:hypothetical protein
VTGPRAPEVKLSEAPRHPSTADAQEKRVGDYVLERRLGSGAMGEVWLARHAVTHGWAAVKRLHEHVAAREAVRRLFAREHRAIAHLSHPHVVRLYEVGSDYIVTQYVEGSTLAHRLQTPLDPATAIGYALQIASALAHAHERGVVHRDVKPSNVLLDRRGNAYLADFGVAAFVDDDAPVTDRAGTPSFMAPEQLRGHAVRASDQYAFGRTVLEMLIGGAAPTDATAALAQLPPGLPAALVEALRRATARAPEDRWPTMQDLADALSALDLADFPAPLRLAPEVRVRAGFAWCTAPTQVRAVTPDIVRADYRLSALEAAGVLSPKACEAFRAASRYEDIAWSAYAHRGRLGPITDTSALARAADLVVILHGMLCTRDNWHDLATALARDNAQAVVLVPDLFGCGESRMNAAAVTRRELSGPGIVRSALAWLELLWVRELPTVLVGHSISCAALLTVADDEIDERIARIAITPMCPPRRNAKRRAFAVYAWLLRVFASVPVLKRMLGWLLKKSPDFQMITDACLEELNKEFQRVSARVLARLIEGFADSSLSPAWTHRRCRVLLGDDDPVAPPLRMLEALRENGFPLDHVEHLVGVGHHPVFEARTSVEQTSRNLHDIVRVIDAMLSSSRDGSPLSTAVESTIVAASTTHTNPDGSADQLA